MTGSSVTAMARLARLPLGTLRWRIGSDEAPVAEAPVAHTAAMRPTAMRPTIRLALAAAALAIAALAGRPVSAQTYDAAAWGKVVEAARKEGLVRYYTVQLPAQVDRVVAGFKKAYPGIEVEFTRAAAGVLMPKIDQERATGAEGADVLVSTSVLWVVQRAKEGILLPASGPSVQTWPAKNLFEGGRYAIAAYQPFVIIYNTGMVKVPPKDYADLLAPDYANKLGTLESNSEALAAWYDWLEQTRGADFLVKLAAQHPKLFLSGAPASQAVASGEIAATVYGDPVSAKSLMATGAPVQMAVPDPAFASVFGVGALSWAKHPNAARVFMDYLLSADGQAAWHGNGESVSPRNDVPGSLKANLAPYDPAAYPPDVVKAYNAHWAKIFK